MNDTTTKMMDMRSQEMQQMPETSGMDTMMMQECIEACSAMEQACTMCADSMMGADMSMCRSMCANAADVASAMMRMMMRPNGMTRDTMMAMLQATTMMATMCADECMSMADMSEECRMCAEVCRQCAMACQKMMDSMSMA
ncbi:hypothetical protein [Glaciihabitans sp. dw_435]|uniref:hypothetical protein n=1 Tax=Glaciihabitans sp. dw_435 TaxID=2720081 RepID=UPI002105DB69|nr:hypothetical protein [Glaciihabitans sp. dw_435]